jgi:hypothetical protein
MAGPAIQAALLVDEEFELSALESAVGLMAPEVDVVLVTPEVLAILV